MASISRPHILLHSSSPSFKLNPSSSLFRSRKLPNSLPFNRRRSFCSVNSTSHHKSESVSIVNNFLDYLNESWTHFHATAEAKRQLLAAGFHLLNENEEWNLKPGGRYFFTRNMSCLVAFAVGENYDAHTLIGLGVSLPVSDTDTYNYIIIGVDVSCPVSVSVLHRLSVPLSDTDTYNYIIIGVDVSGVRCPVYVSVSVLHRLYDVGNGFYAIAAHTDSPCLKLKPKTASLKSSSYMMVNVQTYGGGLWHTWFDRDLSVAGRVILRRSDNSFVHKLVKVNRPILRIPTLAIHLDRTVNQDGFKPNLETHLLPLLSMKLEDISSESKEKTAALSSKASHHPLLMQILSEELKCDVDDIVSIELNVCDTQPSCLGGANNEFIFSGRLDNLASSYCALRALVDSCESPGDLASEQAIRMVALFDNEEILLKELVHPPCFRP
ncbi:aspartyl aminopeptidase [Trifolium pratense]|uniref:aspartyl aminopeptidase n=1 Tax=Trifolium pratense TaxID=57577 RepID=A0A2K3PJS4_TRIPR|nr:aspartyl aminopeptidase [Trifolium pratense]